MYFDAYSIGPARVGNFLAESFGSRPEGCDAGVARAVSFNVSVALIVVDEQGRMVPRSGFQRRSDCSTWPPAGFAPGHRM
jgi:hypothetical protein